jgi:hypothetical protein
MQLRYDTVGCRSTEGKKTVNRVKPLQIKNGKKEMSKNFVQRLGNILQTIMLTEFSPQNSRRTFLSFKYSCCVKN